VSFPSVVHLQRRQVDADACADFQINSVRPLFSAVRA
jgi:hypothetical protein